MKIFYQDKEIYIEPKKIRTTVQDLIKCLKTKLNTSNEEDLILMEIKPSNLDVYSYLDNNCELDLENNNDIYEYILISIRSLHSEEKTKSDSIEKLIMQVTNAKEIIQPPKTQKKKRMYADHNIEYLEQIFSVGNFPMSSLRFRNEIVNLINNPFMNEGNVTSFLPSLNNNPIIQSNASNVNISNNGDTNVNLTSSIIPNSNANVRNIRPPLIEANATYVQNLVDMGFPEDRAKRALVASRNNLNHATEMILNDYDIDLPENSMVFEGIHKIIKGA